MSKSPLFLTSTSSEMFWIGASLEVLNFLKLKCETIILLAAP